MFDRSRVRLTLGYVGILTFILLLFGAVVVVGFRSVVADLGPGHRDGRTAGWVRR